MENDYILDCTSVESTYRSFERILQLSRTDIDSIFNDFDLAEHFTANPKDDRRPGEILLEIFSHQGCETKEPDETYWFHATRIPHSEKFADGIRPLHAQLEHIWKFLFTLVSDTFQERDWMQFRIKLETQHDSHHAHIYRIRTEGDIDSGPFGLLLREVAINPEEFGSVDYLAVPEIIEDICISFGEIYGEDLLEKFEQKTRPCIVTFSESEANPKALHKAIEYIYSEFCDEPKDGCNTTYNGMGNVIPAEQIVKVEYL